MVQVTIKLHNYTNPSHSVWVDDRSQALSGPENYFDVTPGPHTAFGGDPAPDGYARGKDFDTGSDTTIWVDMSGF